MAKQEGRKLIASNRKARHDYLIEDTYEAGLALTGTEVKALRMGRASLADGWAGFDSDGELWLEGVYIPGHLDQPHATAQAQTPAAPARVDQDSA